MRPSATACACGWKRSVANPSWKGALFARRPALLALGLGAALFLGGCQSILDFFGRGSSGPKPAELPVLANPQTVRVLWQARVGTADRFTFFPILVGDSVYAAARDGTVTRLDASSGQERWRASADRRISAGVGSDGRTVAVATDEGEVIALDASNGAVRWRARVSSEVFTPPAVAGGLVLVRAADNRIFAFSDEDGKRRWVYQRIAASLIMRAPSNLAVADETVFAGFSGGKLLALALPTGGVRWESTVSFSKGSTELERVSDVGEPAVQGREVCAAAYQGRVTCFETTTGRQTWTRDLSSLTGVSLDARYAYVSDEKGAVHALDRSSGRSLWKQDRLAYRQLSMPRAIENAVVVGDLEGYVHFLARDSGAFLARHGTSGGPVRAAPIPLPGGAVLIQTQNGGLFALSL